MSPHRTKEQEQPAEKVELPDPIVAISIYPTKQGSVTHTLVIQDGRVIQEKIDDPELEIIAFGQFVTMSHYLINGELSYLGLEGISDVQV